MGFMDFLRSMGERRERPEEQEQGEQRRFPQRPRPRLQANNPVGEARPLNPLGGSRPSRQSRAAPERRRNRGLELF